MNRYRYVRLKGGHMTHTGRARGAALTAKMSAFFKIMADETRLRILTELLESSLCVTHICERLDMSQSAISHQLALLRVQALQLGVQRLASFGLFQKLTHLQLTSLLWIVLCVFLQ